jgi:hypothetical protein
MIKMLRPSAMLAKCDECRLPFDPVQGGVCSRCNRLLCRHHIFGSVLRRLQSYLGGSLVCVACRVKAVEGTAQAPPPAG